MAKSRLHQLSELRPERLDRLLVTRSSEGRRARPDDARGRGRRSHVQPDDLPEVVRPAGVPTTSSSPRCWRRPTIPRSSFGLAGTDVGDACDLLRPMWEATSESRLRVDGGRSDARLRHRGDDREAARLHAEIDRPNLFVKIPATQPGLPAIEDMIAKGKSINVTLIFSLERYVEVAEAYIRGLQRLAAAAATSPGLPPVASFFVSRVDTKADRGSRRSAGRTSSRARWPSRTPSSRTSGSRSCFRRAVGGARRQGRPPQRCLWASTSTKNPAYRDVLYVEELIGPQTIDTMPEETIRAFQDHGRAELTLDVTSTRRTRCSSALRPLASTTTT